jgi:cbb3-type cytochrome oxidase maturation protein
MEVLVYLVPMALALGLLGLGGFLWSLKSGQYDDLDGAAWRAILDEDEPGTAKPGDGDRRRWSSAPPPT